MADRNWATALTDVLVYEGGKVDDPQDPGGRTAYGVTQRVYDGYRTLKNLPKQDVFKISTAEVTDIYKTQYANRVDFDALPDGLDCVMFDCAVNSGVARAILWLQRALGGVKVDGSYGPATKAALKNVTDVDLLIQRLLDRRLAFVKALKTWKRFGKGWSRRIEQVRLRGQALAIGTIGPIPVWYKGMEAKANMEDARSAPSLAPGSALSGGGVVTVALQQTTDAIQPLSAVVPVLGHLSTVLTTAGALAAIGGGLYATWASKRRKMLNDALDIRPTSISELTAA